MTKDSIEITICRISLHENLFYSTREIGRLYETGRYLHNYGLAYALGLTVSDYFNDDAIPRYQEELTALNERRVYVTPARPLAVAYHLNTFKYADNRYRVKMELSSRNTPSFGRAKELAVGSTFECAVLAHGEWHPPSWIRLGKLMSKAALEVLSRETVSTVSTGEFEAAFPINPLDLSMKCQPRTYDLISMPPVSLLDNALLTGPYYRLSDRRCLPAGLAYRFSVD